MSYFAVTIEEISDLRPHSNADRLEIASLKGIGFQFIVPKGIWRAGDRCLYFPLDAILPEEVLSVLGLQGKLSGAQKNRVKTIKLRGEISQGLVGPLSLIAELSENERNPDKITAFLGVTKFEPEIDLPMARDARLVDLPEGVGIYDIENCERYPTVVEKLMHTPVWISEKLEGSHFAVAAIAGKIWVCQRRFALEVVDDKPLHYFWEVAKKDGVFELVASLVGETKANHLVLRGEFLGPNIQSNIYRLAERQIRFYDLQIEHKYMASEAFIEIMSRCGAKDKLAPTVAIGVTLAAWLAGRTLPESANGASILYPTNREGIVIKPLNEEYSPELNGRLVLKQISPEYLAQKN